MARYHLKTARIATALPLIFASLVEAQIAGELIEAGEDNTGLWIDVFVASTQYGDLSDVRSRGATIAGNASVVVFPQQPPFNGLIVDSWSGNAESAEIMFQFGEGLDILVTLVDYETYLVECAQALPADFGPPGRFNIGTATYYVLAVVHVESKQLGLDVSLSSTELIQAPLTGQIALSAGDLFLGRTRPPVVSLEADPDNLPAGIVALAVEVSMDAGNTNYHGPATPALLGDSDLDGDVDLSDYVFGISCTASSLLCLLHDFDGDDAITLLDFAGFQRAFTGEASGP